MHPKDAERIANSVDPDQTALIANSVDPDQTAPVGAVWSGSTLFAQAYLSENLGSLRYIKLDISLGNCILKKNLSGSTL